MASISCLPLSSRDEMGFLVHSFNDMTKRLARAREETRRSQQIVENERASLEIILARLSGGVVAVEPDLRVRFANRAASTILGVDLEGAAGRPLEDFAEASPLLSQLLAATRQHLASAQSEWRDQLTLSGEVGRRVLTCACTALPGAGEGPGGFVIVFDDITTLVQAQRGCAKRTSVGRPSSAGLTSIAAPSASR